MQHGNKLYPCRDCVEGLVYFFTWFPDAHSAGRVIAVCSNENCLRRDRRERAD